MDLGFQFISGGAYGMKYVLRSKVFGRVHSSFALQAEGSEFSFPKTYKTNRHGNTVL